MDECRVVDLLCFKRQLVSERNNLIRIMYSEYNVLLITTRSLSLESGDLI